MEYASGGSLSHHLLSHGSLSTDESIRLVSQIIDGMMMKQQQQQQQQVYQMDMDDIMLDHEMDIKIMDARIRKMIMIEPDGGYKVTQPPKPSTVIAVATATSSFSSGLYHTKL